MRKALIDLASGLGKTLTGAFDIDQFYDDEPYGRVLVLCHVEQILRQTRNVYRKYFGDNYSYGMYNQNEKTKRRTDFLFANLQSVNNHLEEFSPDDFDYIVVDEAHHSVARTYRKAIEYFTPKFLLGMTATPDRMDDANISEIFGDTVFEYNIVDAIRDGWLSDIEYHVKADEIKHLIEIMDSNEKYTLSQLNREIFVPKRDEEIARIIREEISKRSDPTTVIFCQTIKHAEEFAKIMTEAVVLHSDIEMSERNRILEDYRNGNIKTIIAVDMLNEGIDVPRTDVVVFLRVTQSKVIFMQQLGRGLRRAKGKGKVLVLDFVSTAYRLEMLYQFEREFDQTTKRYPRKTSVEREHFKLEMDTPVFMDRKVDIIGFIEKARRFHSTINDEELLQLLRDFKDKFERVPSKKDVNSNSWMPSSTTYSDRFGSFNMALIAADLQPNQMYEQWKNFSDDELSKLLHDFSERLGRVPTIKELNNEPGMPCSETYRKRFGSFTNSLIAAGITPVRKRNTYLTDEKLLKKLREFKDKLGRTPTRREVDNAPEMPCGHVYSNRFGDYNKALIAAGLKPNVKKQWANFSNEDLSKRLKDLGNRLNKIPSGSDATDDPDTPSASVYEKRFGNFTNALIAAGFKPNPVKQWSHLSDEELLELLRNFSHKLGKTPTKLEVDKEPGLPHSTVYGRRFKGFTNALIAAGLKQPEK